MSVVPLYSRLALFADAFTVPRSCQTSLKSLPTREMERSRSTKRTKPHRYRITPETWWKFPAQLGTHFRVQIRLHAPKLFNANPTARGQHMRPILSMPCAPGHVRFLTPTTDQMLQSLSGQVFKPPARRDMPCSQPTAARHFRIALTLKPCRHFANRLHRVAFRVSALLA